MFTIFLSFYFICVRVRVFVFLAVFHIMLSLLKTHCLQRSTFVERRTRLHCGQNIIIQVYYKLL